MTSNDEPGTTSNQKYSNPDFYVSNIQNSVKKFLAELGDKFPRRQDFPEAWECHPTAQNLAFLIGSDLSAGLDIAYTVPEQKAMAFLIKLAEKQVLGLDVAALRRQLSGKHVLRSCLGTHCQFDLQDAGAEVLENCFVVHLDNDQNIVMLHSVYQGVGSHDAPYTQDQVPPSGSPGTSTSLPSQGSPIDAIDRQLEAELQKQVAGMRHVRFVDVQGKVWIPDWQNDRYTRGLKAKVSTRNGTSVLLVQAPPDGPLEIVRQSTASGIQPSAGRRGSKNALWRLGLVYRTFWQDKQDALGEDDEGGENASTKLRQVLLRDLYDSRGGLHGKYVRVTDEEGTIWYTKSAHLLQGPQDSHWFDRVMAYYHVDLIQRYFRDLGLTILDDYPELNPLLVVLTDRGGAQAEYWPEDACIRFRSMRGPSPNPTAARDAKMIYHEFFHAVADAIARLQRPVINHDRKNRRFLEAVQSAAMAEGMADYFACSLAARYGDPSACWGEFHLDSSTNKVTWKVRRKLEDQYSLADLIDYSRKKLEESKASAIDRLYYRWGVHWGRYLWALRQHPKIGADVADILVAHSMFFLTRWAGFALGVWALVLADHLLFAGEHAEVIRALSGIEHRLQATKSFYAA